MATALVVTRDEGADRADDLDTAAVAAAERFLDGYLDADGRVVRRDQAGDTVSEGQAYAMLAAVAVGDRRRFDQAWTWARDNLQRDDGLLAFRWDDGRVVDPQPAPDADLDAARALALAAARFDHSRYTEDAQRLATAVADLEVVERAGAPLLLAGPWATGPPSIVNPSYYAPRTVTELAGAGDPTLTAATEHGRTLLDILTRGQPLPPDWAAVDGRGAVRPIGLPDAPGDPPRYSYDAVRVPVRFAESCSAADRAVAARMWSVLQDQPARAERALDGTALTTVDHPAAAAGSAAAAWADGHPDVAEDLLDQASRLDRASPSYYGAAWVALARLMLTTDRLGTCPP